MGALHVEEIPRYTYDDYKLWDGKWELIDGYPYAMSPAPMIKHQSISSKIARELEELFQDCTKCQVLLPVDWKITEDTIVQPDNSVIYHEPKNEAYITQAPKIIFEVLSKATAKKDRGIKYDLYEKEGVNYYILVDQQEENAKVYQLQNGVYIKMCDVSDGVVVFKTDECNKELPFDFSKIWK